MTLPDKNGNVKYEHLKYVEKQKRAVDPEAIVVELEQFKRLEFPDEFITTWKQFLSLSKRRSVSEGIPLPLSWQDILAWTTLSGITLSYIDLNVITACGEVWLSAYVKKHPPDKAK